MAGLRTNRVAPESGCTNPYVASFRAAGTGRARFQSAPRLELGELIGRFRGSSDVGIRDTQSATRDSSRCQIQSYSSSFRIPKNLPWYRPIVRRLTSAAVNWQRYVSGFSTQVDRTKLLRQDTKLTTSFRWINQRDHLRYRAHQRPPFRRIRDRNNPHECYRPQCLGGTPSRRTRWRSISGGVLARLPRASAAPLCSGQFAACKVQTDFRPGDRGQ